MMQAEANTIDSAKTRPRGLGAPSPFYEVPNFGLTPRFDGTPLQKTASKSAASFNAAVLRGLAPLEGDGLKVFTLDTYDLLEEIKKHPSHFDFTNVDDPCWTGGSWILSRHGLLAGSIRPEPVSFLGWDSSDRGGPSRTAEFAVDALNAVPEVSTWAMMLAGFAGLGFACYRCSRQRIITA